MDTTTHLDPRIGTLNSGRFYAFAHGYDKPETVGTLAEVEAALGLIRQTAAQAARTTRPAVRTFTVTITPNVLTWYAPEAYEVEVDAATHAEAIKAARADRFEVEGRHGIAATYRARLKDQS